MSTCGCFSGCCPEPIAVVQNITQSSVDGYIAPGLAYAAGLGTIDGDLTVQAQGSDGGDVAGRFSIIVWFEDTDEFTGIPTYNPPTVPGSQQFEILTDATGEATLEVQYSGVVKTWYAYAKIGGNACAAPVAITLGS